MVAKPLCPLYKNIIKPLDRARYPELRYYWSSSATAEVDFLISDGLDVYPLEAKAGVTMNAKSLKLYREKYSPKWSVRTSLLPYERNNSSKTINIPLYILFVLDKELKAES